MMQYFLLQIASLFLFGSWRTQAFTRLHQVNRLPSPSISQPHTITRTFAATQAQDGAVWYDDSLMLGGINQRRPIMAGNWKLNPATFPLAVNLLKLLASNFVNHRTDGETPEVVVFPPFPFLLAALSELEGTGIKVGAQNVGLETTGAFTGEVAASMVRSMGCDYVMLGHSERRALYDETDSIINSKVRLCLNEPGLKVILCVGETEEEYENELLESVVDVQIKKGLMGINPSDLERIVIA